MSVPSNFNLVKKIQLIPQKSCFDHFSLSHLQSSVYSGEKTIVFWKFRGYMSRKTEEKQKSWSQLGIWSAVICRCPGRKLTQMNTNSWEFKNIEHVPKLWSELNLKTELCSACVLDFSRQYFWWVLSGDIISDVSRSTRDTYQYVYHRYTLAPVTRSGFTYRAIATQELLTLGGCLSTGVECFLPLVFWKSPKFRVLGWPSVWITVWLNRPSFQGRQQTPLNWLMQGLKKLTLLFF